MGLFSSILARIGGGQSAPARTPGLTINPAAPMSSEDRKKLMDSLSVKGQSEEWRYSDWQKVSSSWIDALRFNPLIPLAQMRVKGGKVYSFGGMKFDVFKAWLLSGSKGAYFNAHLIGRYTQWEEFESVGKGIKATEQRLLGNSVLKELGIK